MFLKELYCLTANAQLALAQMSDPKEALEEKCKQLAECRPLLEELEKCTKRVEARGEANTETCVQELFELTPCIDKCVSMRGSVVFDFILLSFVGCQKSIQKIEIKQ